MGRAWRLNTDAREALQARLRRRLIVEEPRSEAGGAIITLGTRRALSLAAAMEARDLLHAADLREWVSGPRREQVVAAMKEARAATMAAVEEMLEAAQEAARTEES